MLARCTHITMSLHQMEGGQINQHYIILEIIPLSKVFPVAILDLVILPDGYVKLCTQIILVSYRGRKLASKSSMKNSYEKSL